MSVSAVTRMWSRIAGNYANAQFSTFETEFSLVDAYQCVHTVDTEIPEVLSDSRLPRPGDRHPSGNDAFVRSRVPERISPILTQVTINYEGMAFDAGEVDVQWTGTTSTEPIDRDYNGAAITTATGEPVQGLTVELTDPAVVIKRQYLFINQYSLVGPYWHSTNSDTFLGWPPGTARLVAYDASNKFKFGGQLELWTVTAKVQFRYPYGGATPAQAWHKRWRHEGIYCFRGGVIGKCLDERGQEVSSPALLTETGEQERNPNAAIFRYTKVYGSLPYSALGLV